VGVFGERRDGGVGGAEVVLRGEQELQAAGAGGNGDDVEELDGFIHVGREGLASAEDGDSAANVASEGFDFFQGNHFGFASSAGAGQLFEVEFVGTGDDGEDVFALAGGAEKGFEDLLGREADFLGYEEGGEFFRIDAVLAQVVVDAEGVEVAGGVGLLGWPPGFAPWSRVLFPTQARSGVERATLLMLDL